MLVKPENATPRVQVTVDLLSRILRPYLFRVVAVGLPPHAFRRVYTIRANSDDEAALAGIDQFVREFTPARIAEQTAPMVPRAVLQ